MKIQFSIGEHVDVVGCDGATTAGRIVGYSLAKVGPQFHVHTDDKSTVTVPADRVRFRTVDVEEQLA